MISIINIVVVVGCVEKSISMFHDELQPKARPQPYVVNLFEMFGIFRAFIFVVE